MKAETLDRPDDLVVIGVALHTTPERAEREIPAFWQRFRDGELGHGVPSKADDDAIYCVYCDYQSDHSGPYTMVVGTAVPPETPVPPGMRRVRVPRGPYALFRVKGVPTEVIWPAWEHVNTAWKRRGERRYIADVERYVSGPDATGAMEAELWVGLSP